MNIASIKSFLTAPRTIESAAPARFRQYEYDGRGLVKQRLLPAQQDSLNAKLADAAKARDASVDGAAELRATKLKQARDVYEAAREAIERDHRQAQHKANVEFDEIESKLLAEYAAPLSPEQIALMTTRVGEVVRIPSVASADTAGAVPNAVTS